MKYIKNVSIFLLTFCFSVSLLSFPALAKEESVLTIKNLKGDFEVSPKSSESDSDLFSAFKQVMPGDTLTQKIKIQNHCEEHKKVNLYLSSTLSQTESTASLQELLSMLHLRIWEKDKLLFEQTADQNLSEPIDLGALGYQEEEVLKVELEIPVEVDNEQAENIAMLEWTFDVEDAGMEDDQTSSNGSVGGGEHSSNNSGAGTNHPSSQPRTGDTAHVGMWIIVCFIALVSVIYIFSKKHKNK